MRVPPLSVKLSWPTPNYTNPELRGDGLYITLITFSILVFIAVVVRLCSRIFIKRFFGWDDGLIIPAAIFTLSTNVVVILAQSRYGWDRHEWDLRPDMIQPTNISAYVAKMTFMLGSMFCRLSLICFYYRLVRDSSLKWFQYILHASLAFNVVIGLAFVCLSCFGCTPIKAYWTYPRMRDGRCIDESIEVISMGVVFTTADFLTTITPIPLVMSLQMPTKDRVWACLLLSLGFVVTVAGCIRTYFVWRSMFASWDQTWEGYFMWISAAVELDIAVLCACAPALNSLLCEQLSKIPSQLKSGLSSIGLLSSARRSGSFPSFFSDSERPSRSRFFTRRHGDVETAESKISEDDAEVKSQQGYHAREYTTVIPNDPQADHHSVTGAAAPPPKLQIIMRQSINQVRTTDVMPSPGFSIFNPRSPSERSWRCKAWVTGGFTKK